MHQGNEKLHLTHLILWLKIHILYYRGEREQLDHKRNVAEKKVPLPHSSKYTFEMLNSGDETDEETPHPKPGRPTAPEWSLSKLKPLAANPGFLYDRHSFQCTEGNREERITSQSYLSLACVEQLFPTAAMTINLRDVFSGIEEKYLLRGSSAIWKTPPIYSTMQLPKYDA